MEPGTSVVGAHAKEVARKPLPPGGRRPSRTQSLEQRKRAFHAHMEQLARDLHLTGERLAAWDLLPVDLLVRVFKLLPLPDRGRCAAVCKCWSAVCSMPVLWREFMFEFMQRTAMMSSSTSVTLTKQIFEKHRDDLRHVTLKVDSHQQSVQMACDVLQQLGNCSLQSLQLVTVAGPSFAMAEPQKVSTALMKIASNSSLKLLAVEETPADDALLGILASKSQATLVTLKVNGCPSVSAAGMSSALCRCVHLHELSLDYCHLSDALLQALCIPPHVPLKSLTVNVAGPSDQGDTEKVSWPSVSSLSWDLLAQHSPNVSFTMQFRIMKEEHYAHFFHCMIPVTALRFEWFVPVPVLSRVSRHCPRLQMLLISSSGEEAIDGPITEIAERCRELRALELGSCVVNCTTVVQVAKLCGPRLAMLVVPEELVLEDGDCNLQIMSNEVSCFLQRPWDVVFMPTWLE